MRRVAAAPVALASQELPGVATAQAWFLEPILADVNLSGNNIPLTLGQPAVIPQLVVVF